MAEETTLEFFEDNAVDQTMKLTERSSTTGEVDPINLTGLTVELIVAESKEAAALVTYSSAGVSPAITINDAAAGEITVAISTAATADPGTKRWKVDVIDGSKRRTVGYGPFEVINT